MASKRPLCLYSGNTEEMRAGDSLDPTGGLREAVVSCGTVSGSVQFDLSKANCFTLTANGPLSPTFSGQPSASQTQVVLLRCTWSASPLVSWPAGTEFSGGVAPTLTPSGTDVLGVWFDPATSAYVVGVIFRDVK